MELRDILKQPMSAAAYLEEKRTRMKDKYTAIMDEVRARRDDEPFVKGTLREADNAIQHLFVLPGTDGKLWDVGTPPRWYECGSGDEEFTWVLNRHYWFTSLANAYLLTGDGKYAEAAMRDLEHWIDSCPRYPVAGTDDDRLRREFGHGVNPWRSFEAGVRMSESWRALYERLLLTEYMTPELHAKMSISAFEHADMLMVVGPLLHPKADHNHYLVQMQGVLDAVCLFPEWRVSEEWKAASVVEVVRCALFQFTDEGGQIEGSPGYHSMCLLRLFTIQRLAMDYGFELSERFHTTMQLASEYMCHAISPSGYGAALGDTGTGRLAETVVESYYKQFGELGVFRKLMPVMSPAVKARLPEALVEEAETYARSLPAETHFQTALDQYAARTGWDTDDSYFLSLCHSPVCNGHSHQDPLTFVLTLHGDDLIIDPAAYTYQNNVARRVYKSPAYHSCLTFGHRPPYYCTSSWGFTPQKEGHLYRAYRVGDVMAVDGSHDNYLPNEHRRLFAMVDKDVFLVADRVKNMTGEDVQLYFHVNDPTLTVRCGEASGDRVRILWAGDLQAQAIDAARAAGMDSQMRTRRLVIEDVNPRTDALYLTVFTKDKSVCEPRIEYDGDAVVLSYKKNGQMVVLVWKFNDSLCLGKQL